MSTPTQIKDALADILSTLNGVDQALVDNYLPPVETRTAAAVVPPFGQRTRVDVLTTAGSRFAPESQTIMVSHQFRCELWVKLDTGRPALTLARASNLPIEAIRAILANPTLNGTVDRVGNYGIADNRTTIETETIDRPVQVAGVPYIVIVVTIPVICYEG
jgi:hypothetical protein